MEKKKGMEVMMGMWNRWLVKELAAHRINRVVYDGVKERLKTEMVEVVTDTENEWLVKELEEKLLRRLVQKEKNKLRARKRRLLKRQKRERERSWKL